MIWDNCNLNLILWFFFIRNFASFRAIKCTNLQNCCTYDMKLVSSKTLIFGQVMGQKITNFCLKGHVLTYIFGHNSVLFDPMSNLKISRWVQENNIYQLSTRNHDSGNFCGFGILGPKMGLDANIVPRVSKCNQKVG